MKREVSCLQLSVSVYVSVHFCSYLFFIDLTNSVNEICKNFTASRAEYINSS